MSFMQPQMTVKMWWWEISTLEEGVTFVPEADLSLDQIEEMFCSPYFTLEGIEAIKGYGTRWSAPGYMDCTEWEVFGKESDAQDRINEMQQEIDDAEYNEARADWGLSQMAPLGEAK